MAKVKALSRNKTIKFYHQISGRSYKSCRADLKASNWDLLKVYENDILYGVKNLTEGIENLVYNIVEIGKQAAELISQAIGEIPDRLKMATAKDITEDPPVYYLGGVDMSDTKDITIY